MDKIELYIFETHFRISNTGKYDVHAKTVCKFTNKIIIETQSIENKTDPDMC